MLSVLPIKQPAPCPFCPELPTGDQELFLFVPALFTQPVHPEYFLHQTLGWELGPC